LNKQSNVRPDAYGFLDGLPFPPKEYVTLSGMDNKKDANIELQLMINEPNIASRVTIRQAAKLQPRLPGLPASTCNT